MHIYTGIDMVEIGRIQRLIEKSGGRFLNKHFTENEIKYCNQKGDSHFSGLFAVKEAAYKMLKIQWTSGFNWKNIETVHTPEGIPQIAIHGCFREQFESKNFASIDVSISYSGDYAIATVAAIQLQA